MERSVAFKICQNPFLAGALPQTLLGELTMLPRSPSRLGPTTLGTKPPLALAMHSTPKKKILDRSTPMFVGTAAASQ